VACNLWDVANPWSDCTPGDLAKGLANDAFSGIAKAFGQAAIGAAAWLWEQIDAATSLNLKDPALTSEIAVVGGLAVIFTMGIFLMQIIASVLLQHPGGLARAVRGLAVSFLGAAAAITITQTALAAVDALSSGVITAVIGGDAKALGARLVNAGAVAQVENPAMLLIAAVFILIAIVIVWAAMMVRKMLIIIAAVFAPIAFSGAASKATAPWVKRWIEFTIALVVSKLVLAIILVTGVKVLDGAGSAGGGITQQGTQLAIGILILCMAGFAPWVAIKSIHFASDSFHAIHQHAQGAKQAASTVTSAPTKLQNAHSRGHQAMNTFSKFGAKPAVADGPAPQAKPPAAAPGAGGSGGGGAASGAATAGPAAAAAAPAMVAKAAADAATNAASKAGSVSEGLRKPPGGEQSTTIPKP
jgi:type IV secretion system protein TrbL